VRHAGDLVLNVVDLERGFQALRHRHAAADQQAYNALRPAAVNLAPDGADLAAASN
jgi:hypothetical protein